jgi:hypothetical protein
LNLNGPVRLLRLGGASGAMNELPPDAFGLDSGV